MELLRPALIGMALAAIAALLATLLAAVLGRGRSAGNWGVPPALGLGYVLAHAAVREWLKPEWPPFPPLDVIDWVPWLALGAMVLGLLEVLAPGPAWTRWENRLLLSALTLTLLLRPLMTSSWEPRDGALILAGLGAGLMAFWGLLEHQSARLGRGVIPPLIVLALGTSGVLLLLTHSLALAGLGLGLTAGLIACGLAVLARPGCSLARGGVPVVAVVLAALVVTARHYTYPELHYVAAIALAVAPAFLWADRIGPLRRLRPWQAAVVDTLAMLIPVGVAAATTLLTTPPAMEGF